MQYSHEWTSCTWTTEIPCGEGSHPVMFRASPWQANVVFNPCTTLPESAQFFAQSSCSAHADRIVMSVTEMLQSVGQDTEHTKARLEELATKLAGTGLSEYVAFVDQNRYWLARQLISASGAEPLTEAVVRAISASDDAQRWAGIILASHTDFPRRNATILRALDDVMQWPIPTLTIALSSLGMSVDEGVLELMGHCLSTAGLAPWHQSSYLKVLSRSGGATELLPVLSYLHNFARSKSERSSAIRTLRSILHRSVHHDTAAEELQARFEFVREAVCLTSEHPDLAEVLISVSPSIFAELKRLLNSSHLNRASLYLLVKLLQTSRRLEAVEMLYQRTLPAREPQLGPAEFTGEEFTSEEYRQYQHRLRRRHLRNIALLKPGMPQTEMVQQPATHVDVQDCCLHALLEMSSTLATEHGDGAIPLLQALLVDPRVPLNIFAVDVLTSLNTAKSRQLLISLIGGQRRLRGRETAAWECLGRIAVREDVVAILDRLDVVGADAGNFAAGDSLSSILQRFSGRQHNVDTLRRCLLLPWPIVGTTSVRLLVESGKPAAVKCLVEALASELQTTVHVDVQLQIVVALKELGALTALPQLLAVAERASGDLAYQAVQGVIGLLESFVSQPAWDPELVGRAVASSQAEVATFAAGLCQRYPAICAQATHLQRSLFQSLLRGNQQLAVNAAQALRHILRDADIRRLIEIAQYGDHRLNAGIFAALGTLGTRAHQQLWKAAHSKLPEVRILALQALSTAGHPQLISALKQASHDPLVAVRVVSQQLLQRHHASSQSSS